MGDTDKGREVVGVEINYMNFQEGKKKSVRPSEKRGHEVFKDGANIYGPDKTKFIVNITPQMQEEDGVVDLTEGDPENETIGRPEYCVVWDGKEYWDDEIQKIEGVEVNNHEANFGFTPRIVIEGVEGPHTIAFKCRLSTGHEDSARTLFVNRH